jgi:hypothetical protein
MLATRWRFLPQKLHRALRSTGSTMTRRVCSVTPRASGDQVLRLCDALLADQQFPGTGVGYYRPLPDDYLRLPMAPRLHPQSAKDPRSPLLEPLGATAKG